MDLSTFKTGYRENNWKFIPDTPPTGKFNPIPTEVQPRFNYVVIPGFKFDSDELWEGSYLPKHLQVCVDRIFTITINTLGQEFVEEDYSYNPADLFDEEGYLNTEDREWEWDLLDNSDLDLEWHDTEPYCTHAIDRWTNDRIHYAYAEPKRSTQGLSESYEDLAIDSKRATVINGFHTEQIIDFRITDKYTQRFFNAYYGRDSHYHVGMLTLDHYPDGRPYFICKHRDCRWQQYSFKGDWPNPSRTDQVLYALQAIRHGNNHGPDWLVARKDFAYMHAINCDASQHHIDYEQREYVTYGKPALGWFPIVTPCNKLKPLVTFESTDSQALELIRLHMKSCNNFACTCAQLESELWDLVNGSTLT